MEQELTDQAHRAARRQLTQSERTEHLIRWKQSGLAARAYAQEHAINYKSLYAWRSQSRRDEGRVSKSPSASFVPVRVSAPAQPIPKDSLAVILRSGTFECVASGAANATELVSLVKALKQEVFDV